MQKYLSIFYGLTLADIAGKNDFSAQDLRSKAMAVYLFLPANSIAYNGLAAIFFEQGIRLTTEKMSSANQIDHHVNR